MKKRRLGKMFLLFIVTLGIYRLYWFAKTRKEMMSIKPVKIPSVVWFIIPILVIIFAAAIFMVSIFQIENKVRDACGQTSYSSSANSTSSYSPCEQRVRDQESNSFGIFSMVLFYIAILAFWPFTAWWLWKYSKAVEEITNEKISFAMGMLVTLLVPDGIDILIIQDAFNKVAEHPAKPHAAIAAKA